MGLIGRIIALVILVTVPATAWAVHPFQVETTDTQGIGNVLVELNGDYSKKGSSEALKESGIITVGAGQRTDFSLQVPYLRLDPSPVTNSLVSGIGDVQLEFKQRIYDNEVKQSLAYKIYVTMPTANEDKGLGTNNVVWGFALMDQQVCHGNILHASLGYEFSGKTLKNGEFKQNYSFPFGLAAEIKLTGKFWLLTELAGEFGKQTNVTTGARTHTRPFTILGGFRYDITKSLYIDLSARAGLNSYSEDYTALAGVAMRF